jgi:hypothetical protein
LTQVDTGSHTYQTDKGIDETPCKHGPCDKKTVEVELRGEGGEDEAWLENLRADNTEHTEGGLVEETCASIRQDSGSRER